MGSKGIIWIAERRHDDRFSKYAVRVFGTMCILAGWRALPVRAGLEQEAVVETGKVR